MSPQTVFRYSVVCRDRAARFAALCSCVRLCRDGVWLEVLHMIMTEGSGKGDDQARLESCILMSVVA